MGGGHACLCVFREVGSCYVAQVILEFVNLLPQLPEGWDYRCVPSPRVCSLAYDGVSLFLVNFRSI